MEKPPVPLRGAPPRAPIGDPQATKNKTPGLQDAKAMKLEFEFKVKHFGLLGVLAWILFLHVAGIYFFTKGFLLTRMVLDNKSSCELLPFDGAAPRELASSGTKEGNGCWHQKSFDKAVVIIIDALRYDFTVPFLAKEGDEEAQIFHDNMPVLYETAVKEPANAFLLPFIADPPTATLQRLKGLTTGTLPTFIDAGSNFAGTAIDEDNLIAQLHSSGKTLVQLGDDTWQSLFPGYFDENLTHPYDSFNVWDLYTVDNGVNKHLFPLLETENKSKWDVIFGHYLGVDHAGHRYGPNHPAMAGKLREMDRVIRDVIAAIDDDTLLVVMGDHGMDIKGDHGGESDDEVEAALWMYSKRGIFGRTSPEALLPPKHARERPVPQIDIVPTMSLLLGMPIPFNNLGSPIEEAFVGSGGNDWTNLAAVNRLTAAQIKRYQNAYTMARDSADDEESSDLWTAAEKEWQSVSKSFTSKSSTARASSNLYRKYQRHTLDICRGLWTRFDVPSMVQGVFILFCGLALLVIYARGMKADRTDLTARLLSLVGIGAGSGAAAGAALSSVRIVDFSVVDLAILLAAGGSMLGGSIAMLRKSAQLTVPLPNGMWGWLALFVTVSQSIGFASNSYTIWEDEILLFFLTTFRRTVSLVSITRSSSFFWVDWHLSPVFVARSRCLFCRSTYYSSATSSVSAPWQLAIPFVVMIFLPSVVRSFYVGSKSYEDNATIWIGFAFRLGLFITSVFWVLEGADDGEWLPLSKDTLKSVRVFMAQLVLGLAFAAGTAAYIYAKPCVSISVSKPQEDPNVPPAPMIMGQDQKPRTTLTILGFGNVYGTRYFFIVLNFALAIILMSKPMGQGTIALLVWQILSLLEILDTNGLTQKNSSIGPTVLGLLGSFYFFKTGHQAVPSSIQWESAFIPLSTIVYPWTPIFIILNTFGAQILAALAVPLTVLWKRPLQTQDRITTTSTTKSANPATRLLSDVIQAATTHLLYLGTINLATTMWAGHLRRHLMLYRIFSPRFMLGALALAVVDVVMLLFAVAGVRWSTLSVSEVFGW
ncbi:Type I phosphodiesterase/nucleotide pyrophosphatase/phosphate transferase [Penicillium chermesinum]|uniref:Type I phosphodiesterase/nucleotide pyrophosphatase/phosphate transferase n=1 Tax=Penicillium chermesinum TaxID=63820 RepID=A0A9W9PK54_9EURO|nr:Type I phosphodiesterase/nucleotide pyrophosphatase/phosphate transferase [Penicillium chermesinum]KAJ5248911.1 Type I phosphodiesterase/nucleotide pyrophosphatase/phosphate transferase [Penicillium chermesinum]